MKITVPLNFQVFFKQPKKSAWQNDFLITDHTLNIREVSSEDAGVAFRLAELPSGDEHWAHEDKCKAFRTMTGNPCNVRVFEGNFYIERFPANDFAARLSAEPTGERHETESGSPIAGLVKVAPRVDDETRSHYGRVGYHHKTENRSQADLAAEKGFELKRFVSYEADSRRLADQLAQNFIIVEDLVLERVAEPKLRLLVNDQAVVLVIDELPHDINRAKKSVNRGNYGRSYTFGVDEYDRACAFGMQFAEEQGAAFVKLAVVEAVSPWEVTFRGENETLYRVAQEAYRNICQSYSGGHSHSKTPSLMSTMTRQGAVAMYDLAMAVEQHAETSPALVTAVRHIVTLAEKLSAGEWFDGEAIMEARSYSSNKSSTIYQSEKERLTDEQATKLQKDLSGLRRALQCFDTKAVCKLDWTEKMLDVKPTFRDHYRYVEVTNYHRAAMLSEQMGTDLTGAAADAALGRGHLFIIDDFQADRAVGAVYVSKTLDPADEPYVFQANGKNVDNRHAEIILSLVRTAAPAKSIMTDELEGLTL